MTVWNVLVGVCMEIDADTPEEAEEILSNRLREAGFVTFEGNVDRVPDTFRAPGQAVAS